MKKDKNKVDLKEIERRLRELHPSRHYEMPHLGPIMGILSGTGVIDGTVKVDVVDSMHDFSSGSLPCQKVTVSFDFCQIDVNQGERPFDEEIKKKGFFPEYKYKK